MKKLLILIRISLIDSFEYRGDMLIHSLSWSAQPIVYLLIWLAVASSSRSISMSPGDFIKYYLWLMLIQIWVSAWGCSFIASAIRFGRLSPYLVKPISYYNFQIANNLGEKVLKTIFILPVLSTLVILLKPAWPGLTVLGWVFFMWSWLQAAMVYFLVDYIVGLTAFWIEENSAIDSLYNIVHVVFSGILIPLALMPDWIRSLSVYLPFRYEISFPLEILLQKLSSEELAKGFAIQTLWVMVLYFLCRFLWKRGLVRYSAAGA